MIIALMGVAPPAHASGSSATEDEAVQKLLDQSESADIAEEMGLSTESMARLAVEELGIDATLDIAEHLSAADVDVKANFESARSQAADGMVDVDPQKTCAKSTAAQIVFGAFGTAVCGAAAAASVGAAGVPCETILLIGTSSLDWGQVC